MNDIEITKLDLVEGGNVFKQGHYLTLGYAPRDRSGELVNLEGKDIAVSLYNRYGVSYETTARFDAGNLYFDVKTTIPSGEMFVEFTATDPNDESYRMKFPTNPNAAKLSVVPSTDDLGNTGITIYTVSKLLNEQKKVQQEYESTVDGKLSTVEQRLEDGIGAFTEDTEIVDARMGETNLRAFNEKTTAQLADIAVNVKFFGAVGDGVTDDSIAFTRAIQSLPNGGTLILPYTPNGYAISNGFYMDGISNITIRGLGGIVKLKHLNDSNTNAFNIKNAINITIENFEIDVNAENQNIGLYPQYTNAGLYFSNIIGLTVKNVYVKNSVRENKFHQCRNINVENVHMDGAMVDGWSIEDCREGVFSNVSAKNVLNTGLVSDVNGFEIEDGSTNISLYDVLTENCSGTSLLVKSHTGVLICKGIYVNKLTSVNDGGTIRITNGCKDITIENIDAAGIKNGALIFLNEFDTYIENILIKNFKFEGVSGMRVGSKIANVSLTQGNVKTSGTSATHASVCMVTGDNLKDVIFTDVFMVSKNQTFYSMPFTDETRKRIKFINCVFKSEQSAPTWVESGKWDKLTFQDCSFYSDASSRVLLDNTAGIRFLNPTIYIPLSIALSFRYSASDIKVIGGTITGEGYIIRLGAEGTPTDAIKDITFTGVEVMGNPETSNNLFFLKANENALVSNIKISDCTLFNGRMVFWEGTSFMDKISFIGNMGSNVTAPNNFSGTNLMKYGNNPDL